MLYQNWPEVKSVTLAPYSSAFHVQSVQSPVVVSCAASLCHGGFANGRLLSLPSPRFQIHVYLRIDLPSIHFSVGSSAGNTAIDEAFQPFYSPARGIVMVVVLQSCHWVTFRGRKSIGCIDVAVVIRLSIRSVAGDEISIGFVGAISQTSALPDKMQKKE